MIHLARTNIFVDVYTYMHVSRGVKDASFSENIACGLNEWWPRELTLILVVHKIQQGPSI